MAQATKASNAHSASVQQAAAILKLINERPSMPTVTEIAALIGKGAPTGATSSDQGFAPKISDVAEEIARLWGDYDALDAGETRRHKLLEVDPETRCKTFERMRNTAHAHLRVLEQLLLQLEPQSDDELLSLLLLTEDLFQRWAADAYGTDGASLTNDAEREWDALTLAFAAMTRWLLRRGAKSPLLKTYFLLDRLPPLAEQASEEIKRAALILIQPVASGGDDAQ